MKCEHCDSAIVMDDKARLSCSGCGKCPHIQRLSRVRMSMIPGELSTTLGFRCLDCGYNDNYKEVKDDNS